MIKSKSKIFLSIFLAHFEILNSLKAREYFGIECEIYHILECFHDGKEQPNKTMKLYNSVSLSHPINP